MNTYHVVTIEGGETRVQGTDLSVDLDFFTVYDGDDDVFMCPTRNLAYVKRLEGVKITNTPALAAEETAADAAHQRRLLSQTFNINK